MYAPPAVNGGWAVEIYGAHIDTFNANSGLAGLLGHGIYDSLWGSYLQSWGGSLGCH